jgi:DNA polymerase III alpha subunit
MSFVHLHVHSQYSFLDGASSLDRLLGKAKTLSMPALALTDHNRLTGVIKFYEKAKALGIKPIIGAEVTLEGGYHLTLLCKDKKGYSNLCRLLTESHLTCKGKEPAATRDMLARFNDGLIALSGCNKGELPASIAKGKTKTVKETADFYREIYGADFFIELIRYPSRKASSRSYRLARFALEQGIPVVATNNVHYAETEEYRIKELLNAIDQNVPVSRLSGYRTVEQYLKSPEEMRELFKGIPEAIDMTGKIASRCNLKLGIGELHFPGFDVPEGETDYSYLSRIARAGALR